MASIRRLSTKKYIAEIRKGDFYKSQTFPSKIQAMAWATELEQSLSTGNLVKGKTLRDAFIRYRDEISPKKKSYRSEFNRINKFSRHWLAEKKLFEITPKVFYQWMDEVSDQLKTSSINRDLNLLSAIFEQAKRWEWTDKNPIRGLRRPKNPQPRDRRISDYEINKITDTLEFDGTCVTHSRHEIAVAFLFAIETAMRQGEIWALTWDNIFLNKRFLRLHETKNGTKRDVPLSQKAIDLLILLSPQSSGKIFKSQQHSSGIIFRRYLKKAGISGLTFHDTRHEALTRLAQKLPVLDLARMVGHRDPRSLMIYYNATAEEIANKLN